MTTRSGVGPLIATVVSAAATFLAAGLVIQFAVGSSEAAQQELRGGVQIDEPEAMYQLIMYDALIAYQCDSSAGGNLDGTGNNDWAPWGAYKDAAKNVGSFTFQDLNESFRGDELKCYGTETSIGGQGIYEAVHPSSREWRNDQEGEHSQIRWSVNETDHAVPLKPCIFVDQPASLGGGPLVPGDNAHNPDNGWNSITDMVFYITDNTEVNSHDYTVEDNDLVDGSPDCHTREIPLNGNPSGNLQGNFLTVNVICDDNGFSTPCSGATYENHHIDTTVEYPDAHTLYANRIRGPDRWDERSGQMKVRGYKLCPGARGYIQTNTGWTWAGDSDPDTMDDSGREVKEYMETRGGTPYYPDGPLPGRGDKEKYSNQDDTQDNSVHPFIVIEDVGDTSNCDMPTP